MTQKEIDERLKEAADEKYREFNLRIVRTELPMLGVRAPIVKALAREAAAEPDFLDTYCAENFEQILLYGCALARAKVPFETKLDYFDKLMVKFDNWAHVDMIVGGFKQLGKNRDLFLKRYDRLADSDAPFLRRIMAVFLLDYCIDERYLDTTFEYYRRMQCEHYYVNMAIAWGLSVALVKFYDRTLAELRTGAYNDFVTRTAVRKARESFRISPEQKKELSELFPTKRKK